MTPTPLDDLRAVATELRAGDALDQRLAAEIDRAVAALEPYTLPQIENVEVVIPDAADMPTLERVEEEDA